MASLFRDVILRHRFDALAQDQTPIGPDDVRDHGEVRQLASSMWLHCQTGFMLTASGLWGDFSQRLATYGAVRREAGEWFKRPTNTGSLIQKTEGVRVATLIYDERHLEQIFRLNVHHTHAAELFATPADSIEGREAYALFGFDRVTHPTVFGEAEPVLQLMMRHTFMAPRQLVGIARVAKNLQSDPARRREDMFRILNAINHESRVVFDDFVANVSPPWTSELDRLCRLLRRNVFLTSEVTSFELDHDCPGFFDALYSRGLLGTPKHDSSESRSVQIFRRPDGEEVACPERAYVILHPSLASYICEECASPAEQERFYTTDFIVGEGLPCPRRHGPWRMEVSYGRDTDRWHISVDGSRVGRLDALPIAVEAENGGTQAAVESDTVEDREKAATLYVVLVACAMKRQQRSKVRLDEIEAQARELQNARVFGGMFRDRPLKDFPRIHMCKDSGYERKARDWLRDVGIGLIHSAGHEFSLRWQGGQAAYQHWPEVLPEDIHIAIPRVRLPIVDDEHGPSAVRK